MRILLIEDDPDIADFVSRALREDGYAVDPFVSAEAAWPHCFEESYDLLILDVQLPGRDGFALLKRLRAEGWDVPVLMLTARGEVGDRVKGLDAGADDYLTKPFAVAELRARIRALLRRNSPQKSTLLVHRHLRLDTASRVLWVAEREIPLTTREYAVLHFLLSNCGRLLSKGMIADHVWDYQFNSDENIIEVYIRRLRKKIELEGEPAVIVTVRNGGYMIRKPEE
ncbi:MAG TPA: response regulator transcription factor [Calditrichia bacterium]|nr:response regulator transcription factor [Calditrichota bacterium]HQV31604.1 response regulator transcription factor [Calditrichia bacterium]